jgi:hypothetical protein
MDKFKSFDKADYFLMIMSAFFVVVVCLLLLILFLMVKLNYPLFDSFLIAFLANTFSGILVTAFGIIGAYWVALKTGIIQSKEERKNEIQTKNNYLGLLREEIIRCNNWYRKYLEENRSGTFSPPPIWNALFRSGELPHYIPNKLLIMFLIFYTSIENTNRIIDKFYSEEHGDLKIEEILKKVEEQISKGQELLDEIDREINIL